MDIDVFEAVNELKGFYDDNAELSKIKPLIASKKLDISMEYSNGAINLKVQHPMRLHLYKIYNILVRLYLMSPIELTMEFVSDGVQKSVSKKFGVDEDIKGIIDDLMGLPHDSIKDIIIDTDHFKLVERDDMYDNISIILKKGGKKELFVSLSNYLFPFISIAAEKEIKEEIVFSKAEKEITVDVSIYVDGAILGVKSKKVRLV
ncbi:MAG: hypothetical protein M1573_00740 [Candidatus Parvarchaeota archaeon]|jgi:hypothetical protein|nr:hypothetical protein [Candidatus Parvarchaeota archaeon]MCL5017758.1 hypothetical protein [Candidatus Parvarchaeota archaeon]